MLLVAEATCYCQEPNSIGALNLGCILMTILADLCDDPAPVL